MRYYRQSPQHVAHTRSKWGPLALGEGKKEGTRKGRCRREWATDGDAGARRKGARGAVTASTPLVVPEPGGQRAGL